jgi:hypothetical protein
LALERPCEMQLRHITPQISRRRVETGEESGVEMTQTGVETGEESGGGDDDGRGLSQRQRRGPSG